MSDMTSAVAIDLLDNLIGMIEDNQDSDYDTALHMAIDALKAQAERTEERTETHACDLISRQAAIDAHYEYCNKHPDAGFPVWSLKILEDSPSAQPEIIHCRDCKHWKDSDGVYRRGIGAESKCPVNIRAVYEGNFYCADAERRTDEQTD